MAGAERALCGRVWAAVGAIIGQGCWRWPLIGCPVGLSEVGLGPATAPVEGFLGSWCDRCRAWESSRGYCPVSGTDAGHVEYAEAGQIRCGCK